MLPIAVRAALVCAVAAVPVACSNNPAAPVSATHPDGVIAGSVPLGNRPFGIAVSRNGAVYVTLLDAGRIAVGDASNRSVSGSITVGAVPTGVAFAPSGTIAYVANQFSDNVGVINVAQASQVGTIKVTGDPITVIVSPDAARVYAATNADSVYEIDPGAGTVTAAAATTATPGTLAFDPSRTLLYASEPFGGVVHVIDVRTMQVVGTLPTGGKPQGMALSSDGTKLYVANEFGWLDVWRVAPTVARLDSIALPAGGFGLALTPDFAQIYVGMPAGGAVVVLDPATLAIVKTINTGGVPRKIAFSRDGATAAIADESGFLHFIR